MRHKERVEKLLTLMRLHGIDNFLITGKSDLMYFVGIDGPAALLVSTKKNNNTLFVPPLSRHAAETYAPDFLEVVTTKMDERFNVVVAESIGSIGGVTAVDEMSLEDYRFVSGLLASTELRPGMGIIWELRELKDEYEVGAIRRACEVADRAMRSAYEILYPGITENEIKAEIVSEIYRSGGERLAFDVIVASGPRTALPHGPLQRAEERDIPLREGDAVMIDLGAVVEGYHSDVTRTFFIGRPDTQFASAYEAVVAAKDAAEQYIKPETLCGYPDAVARNKLAEHALSEYFMHSLGHGVGLDIHEPPRMSPTSSEKLAANMVLTCEPGVYIKDRWGIRVEDTLLVTERGPERLTKFNYSEYIIT
ncbi:MAG: Xaa-Pro peptidase family protein [Thaumarchaeota archaeon]|nr:Xaa-Pro peptidase family protein [Candidatus Calditenuaceae archaeon]MDW8186915.1 Xaa-Pro peptidase family protein [Nitrososphaerota archaeon]